MTWARLNPDAHPSWWATRLSLVRRFAAYLNANGVDVPIIPSGLLTARKPRAVPFIYSQDDVDALLAACEEQFADERVAATVRTVIGLLAATGLRISEALNLGVDDIDFDNDVLVIKVSKSAERLVPVHPSTTMLSGSNIDLPARTATHPHPHGPGALRDRQGHRGMSTSPSSPFSNEPGRLPGLHPAWQGPPPPALPEAHLRYRAHDRGLRPRR